MKRVKLFVIIAFAVCLCFALVGCKQYVHSAAINDMAKELRQTSDSHQLNFTVEEDVFDSSSKDRFALILHDTVAESDGESIYVWFYYDLFKIHKSWSMQIDENASDQFVVNCLAGLCLYYEPTWSGVEAKEKATAFWDTRNKTDYGEFLDCGSLRMVLSPYYDAYNAAFHSVSGVSLDELESSINRSEYRKINVKATENAERHAGKRYEMTGEVLSETYFYEGPTNDNDASTYNILRFEILAEDGNTYTLQYVKSKLPFDFQEGESYQFYCKLCNYENHKNHSVLWVEYFDKVS